MRNKLITVRLTDDIGDEIDVRVILVSDSTLSLWGEFLNASDEAAFDDYIQDSGSHQERFFYWLTQDDVKARFPVEHFGFTKAEIIRIV